MVFIGGLSIGMSSAYNGVTQDMLKPLGLSDKNIGNIGFIQTGMNMIGAIFVGWISDKYFSKQLKFTLYFVFTFLILILIILLFIIPSPWSSYSMIIIDVITTRIILLTILLAICGFCCGALVPLFYELLSEVSYPFGISEGTSSTLLVLIINATSLIFIGIGTWIGTKYETLSNLFINLICIFLLYFVKETYQRLN